MDSADTNERVMKAYRVACLMQAFVNNGDWVRWEANSQHADERDSVWSKAEGFSKKFDFHYENCL